MSLAAGCGGGSGSSKSSIGATGGTSSPGGNTIVTSGNNVAPLVVDAGPAVVASSSSPDFNLAFATVVVCSPGTSNCVTIDHVQVDTGSTGLRVPATLLSTLNLQNVNPSTPVAECVQFLDNTFLFGSVKFADVKMGGSSNTGEVASKVPIHVMGDTSVPAGASISTCTGTEEDTVTALGANGLLGVGNFQYDCDALGFSNACVSSNPPFTGAYYTCSGSSCTAADVPLSQQVRNPVSLFAADNNGVILQLPAVPIGGQTGIPAGQGSLIFGIGTQSNNGLSSSAVVLPLDSNPNDDAWSGFTTVFNGVSYPNSAAVGFGSFIDSGTNYFRFLDQSTSGIPDCSDNPGFYCPSSTESLTAVNKAANGSSRGVQFNVSNADTLNGSFNAFSDIAGPNSPGSTAQTPDGFFDWGLPFFYGRNVYTAIWGVTPPSSVPAGPFWAY